MKRLMKDTFIAYLGNIPEEWDKRRVKTLSTCLDGQRIPVDATLRVAGPYPYWGAGNIVDYVNDYIFDDTLVLVGEDGAPFFDDTRSVSVLSRGKIWVNNHIHVLKNNEFVMAEYLAYALRVVDYSDYLTGSVFPKLTQGNLNEIYLAIPPIYEQQAIVRYLDSKCSAIDEAIERHKKIIEKLEEYKISVSSHTVLYGINGNSPKKKSGVKWISFIPESWIMKRGKYLFKEVSKLSETGIEELLTVSQYTGVTPRSQKNVTMFEAESLVGYKVCKIGDIAANTMWLWAGAIGVSNDDGVISPSYNIYRQTDNVYDSDYLDILLRAIPLVQHYKALSTGIRPSRLRLYPPQFLNIKFPVPPMEEQKAIIDYLRVKLERIINSINRQKEIITKLEEYRKSIIYNAVTGKIDCRTENRTKSVNAVDTILKE
jgi:type I restriction enzyme S subunit